MPSASATDAMVLAVNMPAHDPAVGQALCSMSDELGVAQCPGGVRTDGFEDAHDVERALCRAWRSRPGRGREGSSPP